jgi:molybdate transport system substrate-binding protein
MMKIPMLPRKPSKNISAVHAKLYAGRRLSARLLSFALAGMLSFGAGAASADEIYVMISGGFSAAYRQLVPEFVRITHDKVITVAGPSMGNTPQAIPNRLERGERADLLIMVGDALDELTDKGKVVSDSRVPLALSPIGVAVKAGSPKPDISSVDALRRTLLAAKSVAYSDSASGVYVGTTLSSKLGIADQMQAKSRKIPAEPVAAVVARGEAELGFQQMSELLPVPGVEVVGPIPDEVQKLTEFSAGVTSNAQNAAGARALATFLSSRDAAPVVRKTGLTPVASRTK